LLRVFGAKDDNSIKKLFADDKFALAAIEKTLQKDHGKSMDEAFIEIHKKLRDGDLATAENAKEFINAIFDTERYDLSPVGRYRFNKRFDKEMDDKELKRKTISLEDIVTIISHIALLNNTPGALADDIDHLGSRRVRFVGELFQMQIRKGMAQIKRNIQNRMSTIDTDVTLPVQFISPKPFKLESKNSSQQTSFRSS
jgi:DNA-directed RNA polymerase subunit beta